MNNKLYNYGFLSITFLLLITLSTVAIFIAFAGYLSSLGIPQKLIGVILSLDAMASFIFQIIFSPIIRMETAKKWLIAGCTIFFFALFSMSRVESAVFFILLRIAQGTGIVLIQTSMIVMLIKFIPDERSGEAFGLFTLVRLLPYAVVPLFIDNIIKQPSDFVFLLQIASIVALIPILAVFIKMPEESITADRNNISIIQYLNLSLSDFKTVMIYLSAILLYFGYSSVFYYIKQYGEHAGIAKPALFFAISSISMILIRIFMLKIFDRYSKVFICNIGIAIAGIGYFILPFSPSNGMFLLLAAFMGIGWGISMALQPAVLFDISDASVKELNQNLFMVTVYIGFFLGPLVNSLIIDHLGYTYFFIITSALTLISLFLMATVGRKCSAPTSS